MRNMGGESYDYASFKEFCEVYPNINNMISDYNEDGILINSEESLEKDDEESEEDSKKKSDSGKNNISNAAKRAANKGLKKSL